MTDKNTTHQDPETMVDRAAEAARDDTPSPEQTREACDRVWARLTEVAASPRTDACASIRSELDAFVAGDLNDARRALVAEHCRECLPCRKALAAARSGSVARTSPAPTRSGSSFGTRLALAAAILLPLAVAVAWVATRGAAPGAGLVSGELAEVIELEGTLFSPTNAEPIAIAQGDSIEAGRTLRTGKGSRALLELSDGSRVELNERSQVKFTARGDELTAELSRGDVIVEAAKRRERNLLVTTEEFEVAVKGTIFAVGHGVKGSRVGVLEGSVEVTTPSSDPRLLEPGEQMASRPGLADQALTEQVAWSRSIDQYRLLLDELDAVQQSLADDPFVSNPRYSSELLDAMPAGTVAYAAIPNDRQNLDRFFELVDERIESNPRLRAWWNDQAVNDSDVPSFRDVLEAVRSFSTALGDELVVGLVQGDREPLPVLVARLEDEVAFRQLVQRLFGDQVEQPVLSLDDIAGLGDREVEGVVVFDDHVVAGASASVVTQLAENVRAGKGAFAGTDFHRLLTRHYREGAELLVAVDLQTLLHDELTISSTSDARYYEASGFSELEHFVVRVGVGDPGSAVLSFREDRRGVASWLAEPGPMGSLEYVSPNATAVVAAVFKDPAAMLKDLEELFGDRDFAEGLADFERETGLDVAADLAAPLGGEIALALDGPLLPRPAWKVVVEVYDPVRLQLTFDRLVARANDWLKQTGGKPLELREVQTTEGKIHVLSHPGLPVDVHHAFRDGYLVAASSRAMLEQALQSQRLGASVATAPGFESLLPDDGSTHFSLLAYQDMGNALGGLLSALGGMTGASPDEQDLLRRSATACLVHARATDREIEIATSSAGAGPGAQLAALLRQSLILQLQHATESGLSRPRR